MVWAGRSARVWRLPALLSEWSGWVHSLAGAAVSICGGCGWVLVAVLVRVAAARLDFRIGIVDSPTAEACRAAPLFESIASFELIEMIETGAGAQPCRTPRKSGGIPVCASASAPGGAVTGQACAAGPCRERLE